MQMSGPEVLTSEGADAWNEKSRLDGEIVLLSAFTDGCHSAHFMRSFLLADGRKASDSRVDGHPEAVREKLSLADRMLMR